jgi:hypothetical protein
MKLSRSLLLFLTVGLVTVFVVAVAAKIYVSVQSSKVGNDSMFYTLSPEANELKVGEKVLVPVYLDGENVETATAFDVKFTYDPKKLKLTKSTPGKFYDKYLTVKWEDKEAWYALAMTPTSPKTTTNPEEPLLILEFTAIANTPSTVIQTETSTVYIAKTGGFHPQTGRATITIQ